MARHGWLRLTPAYSVKVVEDILSECTQKVNVLDPFAGTSTTGIVSAYRGLNATCLDINPFLVWLGKIKAATYSKVSINRAHQFAEDIINEISSKTISVEAPPIHNIDRWWPPKELKYLCALKATIEKRLPKHTPEKNLLYVAFCRLLIKISNASFSHQSMSFQKNVKPSDELFDTSVVYGNLYLTELSTILSSAATNPAGSSDTLLGDSRNLHKHLEEKYNLVVTSPPYPNRMSYIRELRPYMYWLSYLREARDAGELDWQAIGGTWGIATSRLTTWKKDKETFFPDFLQTKMLEIEKAHPKNGVLMANYVGKYFEDMWWHFISLKKVLHKNAQIHYIIGNSVFYNILVPSELIFSTMLKELGFIDVRIKSLRKRNSKKELVEFDVSARF